ncbi:hypothetical protein SAMN04487934_104115 [Eubacterium ruminantium]|nr:hypothetical protein SAMN04487934_104115 [Eubacterium ruminantium]
MKTIALRFADNFAPDRGTIIAHNEIIEKHGFVWYGKLGSPVSQKIINDVLANNTPRILLIHSGKAARYWTHVDRIQRDLPDIEYIPEYYRNNVDSFRTWFKIIRFEEAPKNVLSTCVVSSSKRPLNEVSRCSMSPYFIIDVEEKDEFIV